MTPDAVHQLFSGWLGVAKLLPFVLIGYIVVALVWDVLRGDRKNRDAK